MPETRPLPGDEDDFALVPEEPSDDDAIHDQEPEPPQDEEEPDQDDEEEVDDRPRRSRAAEDAAKRRQKAKDRAIRQRQRLRDAEHQLAERDRKLAEMQERLEALESSSAETATARIDAEMARHERDLDIAIEAGDTKAQVSAQRALARLEVEKANALARAPKKQDRAQPADRRDGASGYARSNIDASKVPLEALKWSAKVGGVDTWNDSEKAILVSIEREVMAEGEFDHEDTEFYVEVERRLKPLIPHRFGARRQTGVYDMRTTRQPQAQPSPAVNGNVPRPTSGSKRALTSGERATLRAMGRDPSNPEHVARWIKANPSAPGAHRAGGR